MNALIVLCFASTIPLALANQCRCKARPGPSHVGETTPGVPTPGETTPGETTPGETTPGETTPGETTPGETTPGETTPGETTPGETTPGVPTPGETTPRETTPGETTPGETTPGETTPGETTPGETTPGETTPGGPTPGGPTPGGPTPGGPTPGGSTPGGPTPGGPTPGGPTPGGPVSPPGPVCTSISCPADGTGLVTCIFSNFDPNQECYFGQCKCTRGYHYNAACTCVQDCPAYGDTYIAYPFNVIACPVILNPPSGTPNTPQPECEALCNSDPTCISYAQDALDTCVLNTCDNLSGAVQVGDPTGIFYVRNCAL